MFVQALDNVIENEFGHRLEDRRVRAAVSNRLYRWLVDEARKKPIANLAERLEEWKIRFDHLAEYLRITIVDGKLVVNVAGSDRDTLTRLSKGSDWFVGTDDVLEIIASGLWSENVSFSEQKT